MPPGRLRSVQNAAEDEFAVLVFSGGYTRPEAGARSEGGSYWQVAHAFDFFGASDVAYRTLIEDRARDSLENLVFSICRFRQFAGSYPRHITIVSYDFKLERFVKVHAASLGYGASKVDFQGTPALNPEGAQQVRTAAADPRALGCFPLAHACCRVGPHT
jgi:hypothetical protein